MIHNAFPGVSARFGGGMDRVSKLTLVKQLKSPGEIAAACFLHNADLALACVGLWR